MCQAEGMEDGRLLRNLLRVIFAEQKYKSEEK